VGAAGEVAPSTIYKHGIVTHAVYKPLQPLEDLTSLEIVQTLTEGEQERGVKDTVEGEGC
jgi:hypothetical protein